MNFNDQGGLYGPGDREPGDTEEAQRQADLHAEQQEAEEALIERMLEAEAAYLRECNHRRRDASQRAYGHPGASIPEHSPDDRERVRRMLAAIEPEEVPGADLP